MAADIVWVYGTIECGDTARTRRFLAEHDIPFEFRDILADDEARKALERVTGGEHITPVVLFPDGTALIEPTNQRLAAHLGIAGAASS
jgi:mycoredoxin